MPQQTVPDLYAYARSLVSDGLKDAAILAKLINQGMDEGSASELIGNLRQTRDTNRRQKAIQQLAIGIPILIGAGICLMMAQRGSVIGIIVAVPMLIYGGVRTFSGLMYYIQG